jgi:hypothetical protein
MTSVKQCARASYVEIYWFLSISTTDVTTCDATDAFCVLVWPQPKDFLNQLNNCVRLTKEPWT